METSEIKCDSYRYKARKSETGSYSSLLSGLLGSGFQFPFIVLLAELAVYNQI